VGIAIGAVTGYNLIALPAAAGAFTGITLSPSPRS